MSPPIWSIKVSKSRKRRTWRGSISLRNSRKRGDRTQKVAAASAIIFAAPTVDASLTLLQGVITNSPTTTLHVLATAPVVALGGKFISSQILYLNAVARSNADIDKLTDANHPGDAVLVRKSRSQDTKAVHGCGI